MTPITSYDVMAIDIMTYEVITNDIIMYDLMTYDALCNGDIQNPAVLTLMFLKSFDMI